MTRSPSHGARDPDARAADAVDDDAELRALFLATLDHTSAAIYVKDLDGRFLVASRRLLENAGLGADELIGRTVHDVWPEFAETYAANDRAAIEAGRPIQIEERAERDDGARTYLSLKFPIRDADGEIYAVGGISTDITERTRSDDELRDSQRFLDSVVENLPHMVFVKDADELRFVRLNRAGEELLGYSHDELEGKNDFDFFPADQAEAFVARDRAVLAGKAVHDIPEETIDTRVLGPRTLHTKKIPILDDTGEPRYLLGISEDITGKKDTEAALVEAKAAADDANQAKSEFLSRMSHELRTPLNSILGFAQLLDMDDLSADQRQSVDQILKGGKHLLDLINEVLDISRIETGTLSLSLEPVEIAPLVDECVALVAPMIADHGLELVRTVDDGLSALADRQRLKQVVLNLLSNAVKFNAEGGTLTVESSTDATDVLVAISDTGPGIRPERVADLFTPFERLGADAHGIQGTGLGLALSQRLAEVMGGTLEVHSVVGAGSTFTVRLARAAPGDVGLDTDGQASSGPAGRTVPATVLYIEDNASNVRLMEQILEHRPGVELLTALDGETGLDLAHEQRPALVLLDLHLPDIQGDDVLRRLRADPRTAAIPVVVVSADATRARVHELLDLGARDYISKPLDVGRLLAVVDDVLAGREHAR